MILLYVSDGYLDDIIVCTFTFHFFQQASVPLRITLQDENDNVPEFSANPYTMYVLESSDLMTSIGECILSKCFHDFWGALFCVSSRP